MNHVLKIDEAPLNAILSDAKHAEFRKDDRGFMVGDTLTLMHELTGKYACVSITHIQTGYGIPEGYVMLSFSVLSTYRGTV